MAAKRLKEKYNIRGLTTAQKWWLQEYECSTMLEPLMLEDLAKDQKSFDEVARWNISHYEDIAAQAMSDITRDVPWGEK